MNRIIAITMLVLSAWCSQAHAASVCTPGTGPNGEERYVCASTAPGSYPYRNWVYPSDYMHIVTGSASSVQITLQCNPENLPYTFDNGLNTYVQNVKRGYVVQTLGTYWFLPPWYVYTNDTPSATVVCHGPKPPVEPAGGWVVVWVVLYPFGPGYPTSCALSWNDGGYCDGTYFPPNW